jgi:ATP-dependent Clp protease adaptor protein ClpS
VAENLHGGIIAMRECGTAEMAVPAVAVRRSALPEGLGPTHSAGVVRSGTLQRPYTGRGDQQAVNPARHFAAGRCSTSMTDTSQQTGDLVVERTEKQTREPARFKVLLINDDYTTMDFVVEVLETVFHRTPAEAFRIMMQVHTQGKGLCGVYTFEVAETKVEAVHELARQNGFPLRASLEEE